MMCCLRSRDIAFGSRAKTQSADLGDSGSAKINGPPDRPKATCHITVCFSSTLKAWSDNGTSVDSLRDLQNSAVAWRNAKSCSSSRRIRGAWDTSTCEYPNRKLRGDRPSQQMSGWQRSASSGYVKHVFWCRLGKNGAKNGGDDRP